MDRHKVAGELIKLAKNLTAAPRVFKECSLAKDGMYGYRVGKSKN